jgi:glycosyltransferase involved in cell wall biosynthesis
MFEGILSPKFLKEEFYSYKSWVSNKNLKIVVSSNSTIKTIRDLFNTPENRFELIPVSGEHYKFDTYKENQFYPWQSQEYYFCPANTSPHKNHEILFNGYKLSNFKYPLVISGTGTLLRPECGRSQVLLELLKKNNLNIGIDILNLGYIDDECYYSLLSKCRVLIMPTKAEGGGSFPICEAMQLGIPVICSNIPVILEQLDRIGGEVILFDVNNPTSLSNAIIELENNYSFYKKRAIDQIRFLKSRTWEEVAKEYVRLI